MAGITTSACGYENDWDTTCVCLGVQAGRARVGVAILLSERSGLVLITWWERRL